MINMYGSCANTSNADNTQITQTLAGTSLLHCILKRMWPLLAIPASTVAASSGYNGQLRLALLLMMLSIVPSKFHRAHCGRVQRHCLLRLEEC